MPQRCAGLDGLNLSGSGSYSYKELSYLVDVLKGLAGNNPIYIVNLRQWKKETFGK